MWLRLFGWLFVVLILLAGAAAIGGAFWLKHAMRASLPQIDGTLQLPGLAAAVTVRRDQHGVAHIEAASLDDLFAAQGYVTAQDRLWQMDMTRRYVAGDVAEVLGKSLVPHDRIQRLLGLRPMAERIVAAQSDRDRRFLDDYARGVNAFIAAHPGDLPAEFRLLMYKPKPWQPVDSVLILLGMVQMEDERWGSKLEHEQVLAKLGPTLSADLYPVGSWRDHPPTEAVPDLTAPQPEIPGVPLDESQSKLQDLLKLRDLLGHDLCDGCAVGSNEWAVAGTHTASGKPLMSNDMHITHTIPNIWYEVDLKAPGFHVAGVGSPGAPFVTSGHNDHISWGFTSLYGDTQDIYIEQVNAQGQYLSRTNGQTAWKPVEHLREIIRVRGGDDVVVDTARTEHGPIISAAVEHEQRVLSLKWSANDPAASKIPLFDMNAASSWTDFRALLGQWWGPSLNVIYADDQGHIGYQAVGYIPIRQGGLSPVPVHTGTHEWQGYVPFEQLPSAEDPVNGILATANSRIAPDGYPYQLTLEWAAPYRNERIWKWLAGRIQEKKLTPEDMLALQTDVYSILDQELGRRYAYAIDHTPKAGKQLRQAADLLRSWDGVMATNSPAAAVISVARRAFWPTVLKARLGDDWRLYTWGEKAFAEEELVTHSPAQWLAPGYPNWNEMLTAIVQQGLEAEHAPSDLKTWSYGAIHEIDLEQPLYGMLPWFKKWTGTGPHPLSGDVTTIDQANGILGPSQRLTVDWGDLDRSTENIVFGQSGNPLSSWYRDQWPFWYGGTTFTLPFSDKAIASGSKHTLRLTP